MRIPLPPVWTLPFCLVLAGGELAYTAPDPSAGKRTPAKAAGVAVGYRLPTDGPLPKTYRVTLAIVDPKNPDWIISLFEVEGWSLTENPVKPLATVERGFSR